MKYSSTIVTNIVVAGVMAGCASTSSQRVCTPANNWAAPVFQCTAAAPADPPATAPPIANTPDEPEQAPAVVVKEDRIELLDKVQFEVGEDVLLEASKRLLDGVSEVLTKYPKIRLVSIEGHTDSTGSPQFNTNLSRARAKAVRVYLMAQGINEKRLKATGFGEAKPIANNSTEEGRYQNRRVEFRIVSRDD